MSVPDVRKSVVVDADPQRCFQVFTQQPSTWWPPRHLLLDNPRVGLIMEPRVGGRYYEWDAEGNERQWGTVVSWAPGALIRFTWRVGENWRPLDGDASASEIEVTFTPADGGTTVELAHVELDRLGEFAPSMRAALDGPSPGETLGLFVLAIDKMRASQILDQHDE